MIKSEDTIDTSRLGEIRNRLGKNLPVSWKLTTLGEAFKWGSGGTPKRTNPRYYDGKIPWLIIGDLNDGVVADSDTKITEAGLNESSAKWVEPGSVLLAMYGSIGKLGIAGARLTTNQAIAFTKPDPIDTKYLFYYLMFTRGDLASLGKGATQKNISQTVIKAFPFVLVPLDQQKLIVAEIEKQFSRLDEAVANLKRVKANLKRYKAAVLKSAVEGRLVETEASIARREGRSYETGEQLLQRILETRRSQWKGKGKYKEPAVPDTSDLPKLPEGWVWATVEHLASIQLGKMLDRHKHQLGKELPYLRNINVRWDSVDTSDLLKMFFKDGELDRYGLRAGDVLVCEGGEPGRAAIWKGQISGMMYQKAIHRVRFVTGYEQKLLVFYLEYLAKTGRLERWCTGSTIKHFTRESFAQLPIPVIPVTEQLRILAEVDRRLSLLHETEAQVDANLQRAERLRQSVLASAFTGKLAKRAADPAFPEALAI